MDESAQKIEKSPREQIQDRLVEYLAKRRDRFTAPYGVLPSLQKTKTGKIRTITFGVARTLDATIYIFNPNHITIHGQGALASRVDGNYENVDQVLEVLEKV